ncbi:RluA family pseudouridine synthase [Candidatus Falkowbacteria bacterium]|nr:RluA family pseudouridine synthase [Candidatus Falkowbacteria bacterium]
MKIKAADAGQRLDVFLTKKLKLSRAQIQKLIKTGGVLLDGKTVTPHRALKERETVEITTTVKTTPVGTTLRLSLQTPSPTLPKFKLNVIAKTADYLVINKPAGIPVHPDSRYTADTLIDVVIKQYPEIKTVGEEKNRAGIIHRIDKDVSGLLVIPRNQTMFDHLKEQFKTRSVRKEYLALVRGRLTPETGTIDFRIGRGLQGRMAGRPRNQAGKFALTEYQVLQYFINYSLVKAIIKTGRTHQIRVHCHSLGHPIVGDTLYTVKKQKPDKLPLNRIFLHSQTLGFTDLAGVRQEFHSDLPEELKNYLKKIK